MCSVFMTNTVAHIGMHAKPGLQKGGPSWMCMELRQAVGQNGRCLAQEEITHR